MIDRKVSGRAYSRGNGLQSAARESPVQAFASSLVGVPTCGSAVRFNGARESRERHLLCRPSRCRIIKFKVESKLSDSRYSIMAAPAPANFLRDRNVY